jgi:type IV secretory pathway VirB10-like protein
MVQYDYEKAEENEIELVEGQYVTNIEMVDEDWWMGTNAKGDTGLFPSNYVEVVEDNEDQAPAAAAVPPPAPAAAQQAPPSPPPAAAAPAGAGKTATAQYEYDAAEDNELSFPDGAKILNVVCTKKHDPLDLIIC